MTSRAIRLPLVLFAGVMLPTAPVSASKMESGLERLGTTVSDNDLGEMRGRYLTPNGITFFGLEMETLWRSSDGSTTLARLLVNLDLLGNGGKTVPQVFVSWTRNDANSSLDVPPGAQQVPAVSGSGQIPLGGLDTVHGAVQSLQVAGADNAVHNSMTISIGPAQTAQGDTSGMTPITGNTTKTFADGDTVKFLLNGKELGIVLTGQGNDAVRQTVDSGANQLAQNVLLKSDFNDVTNRMNLTVGIDPSNQARQFGASNAFNGMAGNGY